MTEDSSTFGSLGAAGATQQGISDASIGAQAFQSGSSTQSGTTTCPTGLAHFTTQGPGSAAVSDARTAAQFAAHATQSASLAADVARQGHSLPAMHELYGGAAHGALPGARLAPCGSVHSQFGVQHATMPSQAAFHRSKSFKY